MKIKAKKAFQSTMTGNVTAGEVLEASDAFCRHLIDAGLAEAVAAPKKKTSPAAGKGKPAQSSQAGQASPKRKRSTAKKKAGE